MDNRVLVASWPPSLWIRLSRLPALPTLGPAELHTRPWPSASHIWHRQRVLPAPGRKGPGGGRTGRTARRASARARRPVPGDGPPRPRPVQTCLPTNPAHVGDALENTRLPGRPSSGCAWHMTGPPGGSNGREKVLERALASAEPHGELGAGQEGRHSWGWGDGDRRSRDPWGIPGQVLPPSALSPPGFPLP